MSENGIAAMLTKLLHIQQKQQKVIGRRRKLEEEEDSTLLPRILPQEFYYIYVPLSSTSISWEQLLCHNRNQQKKMSCTESEWKFWTFQPRRLPCSSFFCPLKDGAFFVPSSSLVNEYAPSWGYGFILPCSSSPLKKLKNSTYQPPTLEFHHRLLRNRFSLLKSWPDFFCSILQSNHGISNAKL